MIDKKEFKIAMVRSDIKMERLAEMLGVTTATLSRKVNNKSEFTVSEVKALRKILNLSLEDGERIFFADVVE